MTPTSLREKYSNYHYCIVRECKNTSIKTPGKLWIKVPSEINMRHTWLKLAKRNPDSLSTETKIFFCEDHFDLENDMENYMQYNIMGSVKRIRMKPNCIPSRFDCETNRKCELTPKPDEHPMQQHASKKTIVMPVLEDKQNYSMEMPTSSSHQELLNKKYVIPSCTYREKEFHDKAVPLVHHNIIQFCDQAVQVEPLHKHVSCQVVEKAHKIIQTNVTKHYKSKRVQFGTAMKDAASSTIQLFTHQTTSTSPFKKSVSGQSSRKRKQILTEQKCDSDDPT